MLLACGVMEGTGFYDVKDGKPVTCLKTVSGSK